ncbi:hypothetical protein [Arthrobacter ulcerisalmonis]|uniref:hypothetical protein n=1 Tax=Arthrobacter ulcerisalmonis TaxID=2483813 RepID=UPI003640F0F4
MSTTNFGLVLAVAAVAFTGCAAPVSNTTHQPAETSSAATELHEHDEDHGVPTVTWDASTDAEVKALAGDLMGKLPART